MQRRVRKDGVEGFRRQIELLAVHHPGIEAEGPGGFDLRGAGIHADHVDAHVLQLDRQGAVAAAQVEDFLARLRRQQIDDGHAQIRHKAGLPGVTVGIPALFAGPRA